MELMCVFVFAFVLSHNTLHESCVCFVCIVGYTLAVRVMNLGIFLCNWVLSPCGWGLGTRLRARPILIWWAGLWS